MGMLSQLTVKAESAMLFTILYTVILIFNFHNWHTEDDHTVKKRHSSEMGERIDD